MTQRPTPRPTRAWSPGRVNLIGDHTDYNDGVAMPMAVDLGTESSFSPAPGFVLRAQSDAEPEPAELEVGSPPDPATLRGLRPQWSRYLVAVAWAARLRSGGYVDITSDLPSGAGLSSSAALEVSLALAFGLEGTPLEISRACQDAEQAATGVPSGLMDQLSITTAVEGCASLIDFADMSVLPVRMPEGADVVVVHSGQSRSLDRSAYAARRAECEAASFHLGTLGTLQPDAFLGLPDDTLRRRARHVVTECDRVRWFAKALSDGDLVEAGRLMTASHQSLARDFEVSTPSLDALVTKLTSTPGVYGARLTGAGFGGCVVALVEKGSVDISGYSAGAWRVHPSGPARVLD